MSMVERVLRIPGVYYRIIAIAATLYGVALLSVADDFRTPTLRTALDLFSHTGWGWLMISGGILYLVVPHRRGSAALVTASVTAWALSLVWAAVFVEGASPGGFLPWTALALILMGGQLRGDL